MPWPSAAPTLHRGERGQRPFVRGSIIFSIYCLTWPILGACASVRRFLTSGTQLCHCRVFHHIGPTRVDVFIPVALGRLWSPCSTRDNDTGLTQWGHDRALVVLV